MTTNVEAFGVFAVANVLAFAIGWALGRLSRRRKKWAETYHDGQDIPF